MKRLFLILMSLCAVAIAEEETVVTLKSTVTGNQEQPKVMYLVPWQQPGDAQFDNTIRGSFADELFVPIDRDVFVRGLEYQTLLSEANAENAESLSATTNLQANSQAQ